MDAAGNSHDKEPVFVKFIDERQCHPSHDRWTFEENKHVLIEKKTGN